MKPHCDQFVVVVASVSAGRMIDAEEQWESQTLYRLRTWGVCSYGVVPTFARGVDLALHCGASIIACFHDDLLIETFAWDEIILQYFNQHPRCGLAGFGGALGLGASDIYQAPYDPMQLARQDFISNLADAEVHGRRVTAPTRVACLDGFSLIGRAEFFGKAWPYLTERGIIHHAYDSWLGALAKRWGWEVWMLPVPCRHLGGQTAVGDARYQEWAKEHHGGDLAIWEASHRKMYEDCRGELPIRV